jgi:hypothetical protein
MASTLVTPTVEPSIVIPCFSLDFGRGEFPPKSQLPRRFARRNKSTVSENRISFSALSGKVELDELTSEFIGCNSEFCEPLFSEDQQKHGTEAFRGDV